MSRARFNRGIAGAAIALAVVLAGSLALAGEPPEAVPKILAAVGKADAATLRQARMAFDAAAADRGRDVRLGYAMALAYMQNAKFEQAAQIVDKLPAAQSSSVPIRRLRLWLAVQLRESEQVQKLFGELATSVDTSKSPSETQATVRLLAGLAALIKRRSAADGGGDNLEPVCRELTSSLPPELLQTFADETERVAQAIGERPTVQTPEQASAVEKIAAEIRELQPRVAALQEQFKEAEAAFRQEQSQTIGQLKPERVALKDLQRRLQSLGATREPSQPAEPRDRRDAQGNRQPPAPLEMARFRQELQVWERRVAQFKSEKKQAQASIKEEIRAHSTVVDRLQQDLAAATAKNVEQKRELSKSTNTLKGLQHERDQLDAVDDLSPATFDILPFDAEKERILRSYRR